VKTTITKDISVNECVIVGNGRYLLFWLGNVGALFVVSMISSQPVVRDISTSIMFSEVTVHEV
jgi:hypothetical protein